MTIIIIPDIEYKCPWCSGPYYGSEYISRNSIGTVFYSDGCGGGPMTIPSHFAYKCVHCGKYFLNIDFVRMTKEEFEHYNKDENRRKNIKAGKFDDSFGDYRETENMLKQGFYIPKNATQDEIEHRYLSVYIYLWQSYNYKRRELSKSEYESICNCLSTYPIEQDADKASCAIMNAHIGNKKVAYKFLNSIEDETIFEAINSFLVEFYKKIPDEKYNAVCNKILSMLTPNTDGNKITYAEINRNLGNFEECKNWLNKVNDKKSYSNAITKIKEACDKKIKNTIVIKDNRHFF